MSDVKLLIYNKELTNLQMYLLSPGCKVSHQLQKDNILASIPFLNQIGIDMGLIAQNIVTVSGQMLYDTNSRTPVTVLEEIENMATYGDVTNTGKQVYNGYWAVQVGTTVTYWGIPYMITYDIQAGEGDIINYTIQINKTV